MAKESQFNGLIDKKGKFRNYRAMVAEKVFSILRSLATAAILGTALQSQIEWAAAKEFSENLLDLGGGSFKILLFHGCH